jgi:hypothetical protein
MQPSSLEGLSLGTMLLALLGNALMVPRALHTRDVVWFAGSTWACTAGWGQLLSMALGVSAATGWVARAAAAAAASMCGMSMPAQALRCMPDGSHACCVLCAT